MYASFLHTRLALQELGGGGEGGREGMVHLIAAELHSCSGASKTRIMSRICK